MSTPGSLPPVIFVDLYQTKPRKWGKSRPQTWRWRAISEGNQRILASGEAFTNRSDAMASVYLLFGKGSSVYLRQSEVGNVVLRMGSDG